jgi:hypothetical protein
MLILLTHDTSVSILSLPPWVCEIPPPHKLKADMGWSSGQRWLTQLQHLIMELPDMDTGHLRHLICSGDLTPCFDLAKDVADGHIEECLICFYVHMIECPLDLFSHVMIHSSVLFLLIHLAHCFIDVDAGLSKSQ